MIEYVIVPGTLIICLIAVLYLYLTWHFDYWTKRGIPGPNPLPFYGSFKSTVTGKQNLTYGMDDIYKCTLRIQNF